MELEKIKELMISFDFMKNPVSEFIKKYNVIRFFCTKKIEVMEYSTCNKKEMFSPLEID